MSIPCNCAKVCVLLRWQSQEQKQDQWRLTVHPVMHQGLPWLLLQHGACSTDTKSLFCPMRAASLWLEDYTTFALSSSPCQSSTLLLKLHASSKVLAGVPQLCSTGQGSLAYCSEAAVVCSCALRAQHGCLLSCGRHAGMMLRSYCNLHSEVAVRL